MLAITPVQPRARPPRLQREPVLPPMHHTPIDSFITQPITDMATATLPQRQVVK